MPKPIVLLENYCQSGVRRFVADNILLLKELGYRKFLIEMNSEISPERVKNQCNAILSLPNIPKTTRLYLSTKAMVDMLTALENNNISYDFIDPETQAEAIRLNQLTQSSSPTICAQAIAERELNTRNRDLKMARIIKDNVELHEGGVLILCGFAHVTLLHELKKIDLNYHYCPIIFTDTRENVESMAPGMPRDADLERWISLTNDQTREKFYKAPVFFFDMAHDPTFAAIEMQCGFSTRKPVDIPTVGRHFNAITEQPFTYTVDENYIVTASLEVKNPTNEKELKTTITRSFPSLLFFSTQNNGKATIHVSRLNLPENNGELVESYNQHKII